MKKRSLSLILVLALMLTACAAQNDEKNASPIALKASVWPENKYTEGLPLAPGKVGSALLDDEKGYCGIFMEEVTDEDYSVYMEELKEIGFTVIEETSEEVKGEEYVSIGMLLSNGEKALSISRIPGQLSMSISFATETNTH